jgi:DNA repair photolyase
MRNKVVIVPGIRTPIAKSPGFAKKLLSDYKLDLIGLCGYGCRYCSSNWGNYLRIQRKPLADAAEHQLGERLYPDTDPSLTIHWADVFDNLERQLQSKPRHWGTGKTLVFSMLTDGFSPLLVESGMTRRALEMLLRRTSFRIRVLTKNAVVGTPEWTQFFATHPGRFVVGLSIGTINDRAASQIELGTPRPSQRLDALRNLQDAGVPTYGMLCPVMPDMMEEGARLSQLVAATRPDRVEHVWAEPYNDRANWQLVQRGYQPGSAAHSWFERVFAGKEWTVWSHYATSLYKQLHDAALKGGWTSKLRYLLYESRITNQDARAFQATNLDGVLFQSKPRSDGSSANASFSISPAL